MHFPLGGEEGVDVFGLEVFRRAMGTVDHPQSTQRRQRLRGALLPDADVRQRRQMQHITRPQGATGVPAELAEGEGAFAAQVVRHLQSAAQAQVTACTGAGNGAQAQGGARRDQQRGVHRHRLIVQAQRNFGARHGHDRCAIEAQQWPAHGDFQRGGAVVVAQQTIAQAQRATVHRPRRRYAHGPVTQAAGIVLHTGLRACAEHLECVGDVDQVFQAARPGPATGEGRGEQDLAQVVAVGFHTVELAVAQRPMQVQACLFAGGRPGDQLGDHRVEVRRDFAPGFHPRVDPQALGQRKLHTGQQSRARLEIAARVFRIQACLDRVALGLYIQLAQRRHFPGRQLHHPAHQVHAPHLFGNAVFHLQARVHFEEIEATVGAVEDEFHGAGAAVIDRFGQGNGRRAQGIGHAFGQVRCRGFFEDLLVAPLHRAVAHAKGDDFTGAVTEHLLFQVTGVLDVLFDKHAGIAEVVLPQALDRLEGLAQLRGTAAHAHADTAAAGGALEHHRVAHLVRRQQCRIKAVEQFGAFQQGNPMLLGQGTGGVLEAEYPQLFWRRPDKGNARVLTGFGEGSVF